MWSSVRGIIESVTPNDAFNRRALAVFLVAWALSCWRVSEPPQYFAMQHAPTVIAIVALVAAERKQLLNRLSFALVIAFLLLHVLGARYLYSFVPYDDWSQSIFGFRIGERLGFQRNHYDRLVHFCFGLLFAYPLWEFFGRRTRLPGPWPSAFAICVVLAASAVYEIAEWATAMAFAPAWADAYNGQQGDPWDAQCDMALAGLGAIFGAAIIELAQRTFANPSPSSSDPR